MNKIASFRLCKLSDEELLQKVDEGTDNIFKTGVIPSCHIPARPDSDYDLLIGELLLRFKERLHPSPSAPVVAEQVHKKSLAALDKLIKDQPELIEKINKELDNFGFEGPTISEYFASFGHSPAERREGDAVEAKSNIDFVERYNELRKEFNIVDALRKLQIESSTPPQEPSAKADEMERLKNKLADDFRKNYTLDLNAEGAAEEGFKAGWDKLLVLLQNQPSAKAIAEAAFNAGVDWRNGIITYGAVTNPFPDKEQYLSKFK